MNKKAAPVVLTLSTTVLSLLLLQAGCQRDSGQKPSATAGHSTEDADIKANLAKLGPEDRKLAEAQVYCAVQGKKHRLGSMGIPVKVALKGQTVFLCCKNCTKEAEAHPDEMLARVKEWQGSAPATAK